MQIGRPELLHLFWLLPVLIGFIIWSFKRKKKLLNTFAGTMLVNKLTASTSHTKQKLKIIMLIIGIFFLIFAIIQPQWGQILKPVKREGLDIIVVLDVSTSMLAEDLKPNRLDRAKKALSNLVDMLRGDRIGIITFAGKSFVTCPLTSDYGAAKLFLDIIGPGIIPVPGTAIAEALQEARKTFVQKERKHKVVILLTDGEDHQSLPVDAAREAAQDGIKIYTVGIGSPEGVPIPLRNTYGSVTGHKRSEGGDVVITRLDEQTLQEIALVTKGKYYRSTLGSAELQKIYRDISSLEKKEIEIREYTHYEERFQIFLFCAFFLFAAEALIHDRKKGARIWEGMFE